MHLAAARPGRLTRDHENLWAPHQLLDTEDGPMTRPARRTIRPFLPAAAVIGVVDFAFMAATVRRYPARRPKTEPRVPVKTP